MIDLDFYQVIKWILIVLLAGFIGQFGKSLATYLMKKARVSKTASPAQAVSELVKLPEDGTPPARFVPESKALPGKAEKKAAKAATKMRKKESKQ